MVKLKEKVGVIMDNEDRVKKQPMDFYNMSDFLRGQSLDFFTKTPKNNAVTLDIPRLQRF